MSELIDRQALKDAVKRYAGEPIKEKDRKCQAICLDMLGIIDAQPAASPWHRVEDELPEESKEYIVYLQMGTGVEAPDCLGKVDLSYVTSMYFKKEKGIWFDEYDESYNGDLSLVDTVNDYHVTHWMPFPEAPKEDV